MRVHSAAAVGLGTMLLGGSIGAQRATVPEQVNVQALGPQVGTVVPSFSLPDQNGTVRTLQSIMGPQGLMLVFSRSADW